MAGRPSSVTDYRINLVGLVSLIGAIGLISVMDWPVAVSSAVLVAAVAIPIGALDLGLRRVHRRASTGLDWDAPRRPLDLRRVMTKLLGAAAAVGSLALVYWWVPEYSDALYEPFFTAVLQVWLPIAVLGAVYMAWLDGRMREPRDKYWHAGRAVLGRWSDVDWGKLADLARGLAVKGFFIPLMCSYLMLNVQGFPERLAAIESLPTLWEALWYLGFYVDIVFAATGYLLTFRLLDTHLRSAQPTVLGWVAALCCYRPFYDVVYEHFAAYDNGYYWGHWLEESPVLHTLWGLLLLATVLVFSGATIGFGIRFSNLTNRGIVTGGLYRFTKHPAYVSKAVSWVLLCVPFVYTGSVSESVRSCFGIALLVFIYWVRARTEEAHLSEDPDYVRYALAMNERSVFAWLGRWLGFLRYRPPQAGTEGPEPVDGGARG